MATSVTLIDDVVRISGLPRPTIRSYVEKLRENGLIRKTGRGASAAAMNYDDAAALLAATLVKPTIAEAADATRAALTMPLNESYLLATSGLKKVWFEYDQEDEPHDGSQFSTFGALLIQLLKRAGAFYQKKGADLQGWENLFAEGDDDPAIKIIFYRPADLAVVKFRRGRDPLEYIRLEYSHASLDELGTRVSPSLTAYKQCRQQNVSAKMIWSPTLVAFARSVVKPIPAP